MICCIPIRQQIGGDLYGHQESNLRLCIGSCCRSSSWNNPMVVDRLTIENCRNPKRFTHPFGVFLYKKSGSTNTPASKTTKGKSIWTPNLRYVNYNTPFVYPHNYVSKCVFCIQPQIIIFHWSLSAIMNLVFNIDFRLTKSSDPVKGLALLRLRNGEFKYTKADLCIRICDTPRNSR